MSSRRSTRATSKAASNRGVSPAIEEYDIPPTPSTRRATNRRAVSNTSALPPIANRPSTSYGTNATAPPSSIRPMGAASIADVLDNLQNPNVTRNSLGGEQREQTSGVPSHLGSRVGSRITPNSMKPPLLSSPAVDPSFSIEDAIMENAQVDSSSVEFSELRDIPKEPTPVTQPYVKPAVVQDAPEILNDIVRGNRIQRSQPIPRSTYGDWVRPSLGRIRNFLSHQALRSWNWLNSIGSGRWSVIFGILAVILFYSVLCQDNTGTESSSTFDIGRYIPEWSNPKDYLASTETSDLNRRIRKAERDIIALKNRREIDPSTLSKLEEILPNVIVGKRDRSGNFIIPDDFWLGLRDKIRSDNSILQDRLDTASRLSDSDVKTIAATEARSILQGSEGRKLWDQFLESNKRKIAQWQADSQYPKPSHGQKLSQNSEHVVSRDEFLKYVDDNYKDTQVTQDVQRELEKKVEKLTKQLDMSIKQIAQLEGNEHIPRAQLRSLVNHYVKEIVSGMQLDSLSDTNIKSSGQRGQHRINYFSEGTGAVINPHMVSPTYIHPDSDLWWPLKFFYRIKPPNPPIAALRSWEEHGDCWCTPLDPNGKGFGPSLHVLTGKYVYPDQVVIEHVPIGGSIDPGAAPKDMELFALIENDKSVSAIQKASMEIMPSERSLTTIPFGWVRIGTWQYDAESLHNIQSFPLQLNLKNFEKGYTNQFIVRVKSNWDGANVPYTCLYRVRLNGDPHNSED